MIGIIIDKQSRVSLYQPSEEVTKLTSKVKDDYSEGSEILNRQYLELNMKSVIDDENNGQLMFNAFVDDETSEANDDWKWRGTRSKARNKGIAMHAQLTAAYLLPTFVAQNDDDQTDKDFSEVMRDVIEWMAQPTVSNYQSSFIQVVFGMMTNPVTYLGAEWCEIFQTIKDKVSEGKYEKKEILDEVLSGFNAPIYSSSQILITNAYERNMQKQRAIIKRRYCEMDELEAKYGHHPYWAFVTAGTKSIYNSEDGLFYDVKDDDAPEGLVSEEIWLSRRLDMEVPFVNGIYLGDPEVDHNPIRHRDNRNAPKYNVVPYGYSRIGQHFFYYKSMMATLRWDNELYDAMSELVMNRAILEVDMPVAVTGSDEIDSEVVFPNSVVTFEDPNARVSALLPASNMSAGFNALRETEKSLDEGSVGDTLSGNLPEATQKAYNVAQAQASAKKLIGDVAKSLAESTSLFGDLMKDIAITCVTAPQVDEIVGGGLKLKYRTFLVEAGNGSGKYDKSLKFDASLIGLELTPEEISSRNIELAEQSGYPRKNASVRLVNPALFAKFRYLSKADIEEMFPKNAEYWQPVLLNLKSALAKDPTVDQEELTKKLLYSYFQSSGDKLVKKQAAPAQQIAMGPNPLGEQVKQRQIAGAVGDALA